MLENKILLTLFLPLLLAIAINGIPRHHNSEGDSNTTTENSDIDNSKDTSTTTTTTAPNESTEKDTDTSTTTTTTAPTESTEKDTDTSTTTTTTIAPTESTEKDTSTSTTTTTTIAPTESTEKDTSTSTTTTTTTTIAPTESTEKDTSTSTTTTTTTTPKETTVDPSEGTTQRPPNQLLGYNCPKRNGFFQYPGTCDVYIQCEDYLALTYICPDGLQFYPDATNSDLICQDPSVVKCNPDDPDTPSIPDSGNEEVIVIKVPPEDCNNTPRPIIYIISNNLNTTERPCTTAICPPNVLDGYKCPRRDGSFRFPNTCDAYIQCENYSPFTYICPEGLQFNPNARIPGLLCDDPSVVRCNALSGIAYDLSDFRCPLPNGYFKYADRCNEYIECRVYAPSRFVCPDGLYFNPDSLWRDYPCVDPLLVGCGS